MNVRIVRAGLLTSVQASPRLGWRRFGVSTGGALDFTAWRVLNALVGNEPEAAGLEVTAGLVRLKFQDNRAIAWSGGEYDVRIGEKLIPSGHVALIEGGDELSFAGPTKGFRGWLAVSGGIDSPAVLGSRSTDLRGRFGGWQGRSLVDDGNVPLGPNPVHALALIKKLAKNRVSSWSAPFEWAHPAALPAILHVLRGKDWDSFDSHSLMAFRGAAFSVSPESDRMGVRLQGTLLRRAGDDPVSEAVAPGTVQVPPGGAPILLLGDCQTIGGYAKLAHVISSDLPRAAQLRPGDEVRFQEVSLTEAYARLWQNERDLVKFSIGLEAAHR
jgi:antagonist of KipI